MRVLRALLFGIVLWILIFLEVSILLFGLKIAPPNGIYYLVHFILLILFTLLCSLSYFWVRNMRGGFIHGFILGLLFIIVLIILDVIMVSIFIKDFNFFVRPDIIIGYITILILTSIVGIARR